MTTLSHIPDVLLALLALTGYLAGVGAVLGLEEGRLPCSRHAGDCPKQAERCAADCDCARTNWEYPHLGQPHDAGCERDWIGAGLALLWPVLPLFIVPWLAYLAVQTPARRTARRLAHEQELDKMEQELFGGGKP